MILFECLAGFRLPFGDGPDDRLVREDDDTRAFPADFPASLRAVVERCLRLDPDQRYDSVLELLADLGQTARQGDSIRVGDLAGGAGLPPRTRTARGQDGTPVSDELRRTAAELARGAVGVARGVWDGVVTRSSEAIGRGPAEDVADRDEPDLEEARRRRRRAGRGRLDPHAEEGDEARRRGGGRRGNDPAQARRPRHPGHGTRSAAERPARRGERDLPSLGGAARRERAAAGPRSRAARRRGGAGRVPAPPRWRWVRGHGRARLGSDPLRPARAGSRRGPRAAVRARRPGRGPEAAGLHGLARPAGGLLTVLVLYLRLG